VSLIAIRYVVAGAVALVAVVLLAVIGLAVARGANINSSQLLGLLAFVGTLIGLLANLLATGQVSGTLRIVGSQLQDVQDKVNGHLEKHVGHTDAQVKLLIDQRIEEHKADPGAGAG
jgi:hypothetical protein